MKRAGSAAPGHARAKGPSVADILRSDRVSGPPPLLEERPEFLGDEDIDFERYTSREFFDREIEALWPRAWQWACREEHIQEVGDYHVYEVGPYSVIVVRSAEDRIQAFLNSCTHRGTKLFAGEGGGYCAQFTCPFHGWSFELDGSVKNIPGRWDFPHVSDESHRLHEVQCELWGGFVFINMDSDARPLSEYLDCLPEHFAHFPLEKRHITVHVEKILPANWKAAQEAFMEAYHNFETHNAPNGANAQYDIFGKYVTRFIHTFGYYSADSLEDYPGDKFRDPPPEPGSEASRGDSAQQIRESIGGRIGVDLSDVSDGLMQDSIEYHLFPNMFLFPGILIPMIYRFRPFEDSVDKCIFDVLLLEPLPEGKPAPLPPEPIRLDIDQSYTEVEELGWLGPVYDQDTGNLAAQQKGFKTSGRGAGTLGNYQESRLRRLNMTLDEFLDS
jgi:nitrite reductase/ring-hydroxylating ferredoxin subunit